jgi:hypothetical protein
MPWSRLRTNKSGDPGGLRRYSTIEPTRPDGQIDQPASSEELGTNHLGLDCHESVMSPSPLRQSFEPPKGDGASSSIETPRIPAQLEVQPKRQRFSMLQYRHKSDPQISKTAMEHASIATPPMPSGKTSKTKLFRHKY